MLASETTSAPAPRLSLRRWSQLALGVACMSMIANLQYGWTLFVNPIADHFHWAKAAIQVAFTLFVLAETWLVPIEGWLVDRYGPRPVMLGGGLLIGISWTLDSLAESLPAFYLAAVIGGVGAGAVYGTCIGNALKWFPDRRGVAAGLTAMGFGAGSALTVVPLARMIQASGYQQTFLVFGLVQGAVVFVLGALMQQPDARAAAALPPPRDPRMSSARPPADLLARPDYTPARMLTTPLFWVMYAMFVMMAAGGLMATAQLGPIAHDLQIADTPVTLLGLTLPALAFALSIDRVLNGFTRPFFGWVSDRIGREATMFIAFLLEGLGVLLLAKLGRDPFLFVILTGVVFFAWGEIYSLFPATCGDVFGSRYAAANAGLLYTAKGTAALLVPLASVIAASGGWQAVFWVAATLNIVAAVMAIGVLGPMRRTLARRQET